MWFWIGVSIVGGAGVLLLLAGLVVRFGFGRRRFGNRLMYAALGAFALAVFAIVLVYRLAVAQSQDASIGPVDSSR